MSDAIRIKCMRSKARLRSKGIHCGLVGYAMSTDTRRRFSLCVERPACDGECLTARLFIIYRGANLINRLP